MTVTSWILLQFKVVGADYGGPRETVWGGFGDGVARRREEEGSYGD